MDIIDRLVIALCLAAIFLLSTLAIQNLATDPAQAADLTVCPSGPSTCIYTSVQAAVDAASDGDVIKVAMGTYTGVNNYGGKPQVLYISKSVTIRGGYSPSFADPPLPGGKPTILDAQGQGRVVVITGPVTVTLEGLEITGGNSAAFSGDGAGLYAVSATVILSQSWIYSNTANALGVGNGGGAAFVDTRGMLSLNAVYDNQAGYGGGLYIRAAEMRLVNNTVNDNQAASGGGGVVLALDTSELTGNLISGNVAGRGGGGLDLVNSRAVFQGNTIISNTAGQEGGGGLYIDQASSPELTNNFIGSNHASGEGAGVVVRHSLPRFLHSTIAGNIGGSGLYVFDQNWPGYPQSSVALTNTILASHTVGVTVTAGNTVTLDGVLWYGSGLNTGGSGTVTVTHTFTGDPAFVNPASGDYHILPASAAINRGLDAGVSVDFDGETRDASPDLGADEILPPGCEAYPLALSKYLLNGWPPGSLLTALFSDSLYGMGILRWDPVPASNNIGYVVKELQQPELSLTGYTGMLDASDHSLSAGDTVAAYTGLSASSDFNAEIYRLQASGAVLRVPTWSTRGGSGPNRYYTVDRFVLVKITDFHPEQPDMPVTFIYLGKTDDPETCRSFGLDISPDAAGWGTAGQPLTYTHWLTNTGRYTETAALTVTISPAEWSASASPVTAALGLGQSTPVTLAVTVPISAPAGTAGVVTLSAYLPVSPAVSAGVRVTTTVPIPVYLPLILAE